MCFIIEELNLSNFLFFLLVEDPTTRFDHVLTLLKDLLYFSEFKLFYDLQVNYKSSSKVLETQFLLRINEMSIYTIWIF